jgi:hypothetical protein
MTFNPNAGMSRIAFRKVDAALNGACDVVIYGATPRRHHDCHARRTSRAHDLRRRAVE